MLPVKLYLFGTPRLEREGQAISIGRRKVIALLAYLAVSGRGQSRDHLLALLWPEFDNASARNNLRRDLSYLRKLLGPEYIQSDHSQIGLNHSSGLWLDVTTFRQHMSAVTAHHPDRSNLCTDCVSALQEALNLAHTDFLDGFSLIDAAEFNEWLFFYRQESTTLRADALQTVSQHYISAGDFASALPLARRWLALDPYHEPAHQQLMRLYAWSGQQAAALRQYQECKQLLTDELGVQLSRESEQLVAAIRAKRLAQPYDLPSTSKPISQPATTDEALPSKLPTQSTPFFGRTEELEKIAVQLNDPDCRLLTIMGAGGMGKTRLSIATAQAHQHQFEDGVVFIPLAPVALHSGENALHPLTGAIADALGLALHGQDTPEGQLIEFLHEREQLLILDNFEHLLPAANLISDLLENTHNIKVLVTSRERLKLREEWLFPLQGLSLPATNFTADDTASAAVQLFAQRASQVRHRFNLKDEYAAVTRICQLVEGMPLGIELAAAWVFQLSCAEIADEIEDQLDFLSSDMQNVPDRHQSIRTVFGYSWERLNPSERDALRKLSVFRGGFERSAAKVVAGARLPTLVSLVNKSLLSRGEGGRYAVHELLRQFAAEKLASAGPLAKDIVAAHTDYFFSFLRDQGSLLQGSHGHEARLAIRHEKDNIRAATRNAIANSPELFTGSVASALQMTIDNEIEREAIFRLIVERLKANISQPQEAVSEAQTKSRLRLSHFLIALGFALFRQLRLEEAKETILAALEQIAPLTDQAALEIKADCRWSLAGIQFGRGNYPAGLDYARSCLEISTQLDDDSRMGSAQLRCMLLSLHMGELAAARDYLQAAAEAWRTNELAAVAIWNERAKLETAAGNLMKADSDLRQSVDLNERAGNLLGLSFIWREWGNVSRLRGRIPEAKAYGKNSLELAERLNNDYARVLCYWFFGNLATDEGKYEVALSYFDLFTRNSQISQEQLGGPGWAYLGQNDDAAAQKCFLSSLQMAVQYKARPIGLDALVSLAHLKARADRPEEALALLSLVRTHVSSHYESREKASRLRDQLAAHLPGDLLTRVEAHGHSLELEATAASLIAGS